MFPLVWSPNAPQRSRRPAADGRGGIARELKLKKRVQRHQQRTARKEDELQRQRRRRFAAEKRVCTPSCNERVRAGSLTLGSCRRVPLQAAAELRRTNALRDALETLERDMCVCVLAPVWSALYVHLYTLTRPNFAGSQDHEIERRVEYPLPPTTSRPPRVRRRCAVPQRAYKPSTRR